jgi:hypothetical protein
MHRFHILCLIAAITAAGCKGLRSRPPHATALVGQPSWLPLGPEVYHEQDVAASAEGVLRFRREPRWFVGFPRPGTREQFDAHMARSSSETSLIETQDGVYAIPSQPAFPTSIDDLSLDDQGSRLTLAISATDDPNILNMQLRLTAGRKPLFRQVEHRWSNTLPFLFAFYVDGQAVSIPSEGFGKLGGIVSLAPLIEAGQTGRWNVRVDAGSIRGLLPDSSSHVVSIVAAFSNSQHEGRHVGAIHLGSPVLEDGDVESMVIRSEPAELEWDRRAERWRTD